MPHPSLGRLLAAEFVGTTLLLAVIVGSGIMAERLAGGNAAIALFVNTLATGAGLLTLILMFAPISGAHFNPVVTLSASIDREIEMREAALFVSVQLAGALLGVAIANLMFGFSVLHPSTKERTGFAQWLGEFIATFGLIGVIISVSRRHPIPVTAVAVAAFISAAYWFTSSTSFANPAVTIARSLTDTFTGIRPADAPGFVTAQILGALASTFVFNWLVPRQNRER